MATKPETAVTEPVAQYERAREELCRAEFSVFKGRQYFSLRCWYKGDHDEHLPGKNGLNLPVEERDEFLRLVVALFPEDIQLIPKADVELPTGAVHPDLGHRID